MPKAPKDPNAPKRPMSAYFLWMNENRARLSAGGSSVTEVAKLGGAEWRAMSDTDKAVRTCRKNISAIFKT